MTVRWVILERLHMSVRIIVDSSADLPQSMIDKYDFKIIPLSVHFGEEEYLDSIDITSSQFYDKLKIAKTMPTTSQIPPERFIEYIQPELDAGNEVVVVTLGSNASGTCQSAHIAKSELDSDKITIIDSNALCLGVSYIAIEAAEMLKTGTKPEELEEGLKFLTDNGVEHLFCVDTLEFLRKGGRIKATQAVVAEILNIKPILNVKDAITQTIYKVRGRKKIIPYYIDKMRKEMDMSNTKILIGHSQDKAFADKLIKAIREDLGFDGEIIISEIGATIGTHAGPGVLACFYRKK